MEYSSTRWMYANSVLLLLACLLSTDILTHAQTSFQSWRLGRKGLCDSAHYTVRLLSYDPLIMHLENFITVNERHHLLSMMSPLLKPSEVRLSDGKLEQSGFRTSSSAIIPEDDFIGQCIKERAAEFQGFEPLSSVEPLQITAYRETQEFKAHFDWLGHRRTDTIDRVTTFFAILEADCYNCGTSFPEVRFNWSREDSRWCRIVDCNATDLTVRPLPGSALFWRNLHLDGEGDTRTLHAGLPLSSGTKTGLNIWTGQEVGPVPR